jgi:hypothetical protein
MSDVRTQGPFSCTFGIARAAMIRRLQVFDFAGFARMVTTQISSDKIMIMAVSVSWRRNGFAMSTWGSRGVSKKRRQVAHFKYSAVLA